MKNIEDFKPFAHQSTIGFIQKLSGYLRRTIDLQLYSIYRDITPYLSNVMGTVLDIGCGDCPYKTLLKSEVKYIGIDVSAADEFDYKGNSDVIRFDGVHIPLGDESVDHFICCEVLEHVENPEPLIAEMYRVLKRGGTGFITIPWSARFHYIPHDYSRYTPSKLKRLFMAFEASISERGTDITVICNKLIVLIARQFYAGRRIIWWKLPIFTSLLPLLVLAILWAHGSFFFRWGSVNDPLGYTIKVTKPE